MLIERNLETRLFTQDNLARCHLLTKVHLEAIPFAHTGEPALTRAGTPGEEDLLVLP